jgi:predicted DNA-binding transcriptional regulator AlpA
LVEQGIENPRVGGSIPSPATIEFNSLSPLHRVGFFVVVPVWCRDHLCSEIRPFYAARMPSSTAPTFLDDPLLMAFDALPANKMLHEAQVALLLGCKIRWLEEQRSRGQPPPYVMLGDRLVRYAVGPLRQWIQHTIEHAPASPTEHRAKQAADALGFDEPILRGGHRKRSKQSSFAHFLATAQPDDEWPFVFMGVGRRPMDAVDALTHADVERIRDGGWLCLHDYADALKEAATWEARAEHADQRDEQLSNIVEERVDHAPENPRQRP